MASSTHASLSFSNKPRKNTDNEKVISNIYFFKKI